MAVPPNAVTSVNTFQDCKDFLQLFDADIQIINALKHWFDNLPIHKMINLTSEQLRNETNIRSNHNVAGMRRLRATFHCLVKVSMSTHVDAIGLKLWRDDIAGMMAEPIPRKQSKSVDLARVFCVTLPPWSIVCNM